MIHPHTELKHINEEVGYGVFATQFVPEGTITYVKDSLDMVFTPTDLLLHTPEMRDIIEKYSYRDEKGNHIVSWDFAKYVNHCCNCNTISTGYGFEIAIRDIQAGEQITDEYGVFNIKEEMQLICGDSDCRRVIRPNDFDHYYKEWDCKIRNSIRKLFDVDQPLLPMIEASIRSELDDFFQNPEQYKSVYALRFKGNGHCA